MPRPWLLAAAAPGCSASDSARGVPADAAEPSEAARPICFNDLALSPAGDIYLTAGTGGLWRLPRGGDTLERLT
jgi:hypothetical protein